MSYHAAKRVEDPQYRVLAEAVVAACAAMHVAPTTAFEFGASSGALLREIETRVRLSRSGGCDNDKAAGRHWCAAGVFFPHDLEAAPLVTDWACDLVLCMEVAEHILSPAYLLYSMSKSADTGAALVFSAAAPEQPGHRHVFCRDRQYWIEALTDTGWRVNEPATEVFRLRCRAANVGGRIVRECYIANAICARRA